MNITSSPIVMMSSINATYTVFMTLRRGSKNVLSGSEYDRPWLILHSFSKLGNGAVHHAYCLAVLHTGRLLPSLSPFRTEVAESGRKWDVINVDFTWALGYNLVHLDTPCPCWIIVLLLAGYLTGMASGAVFIFNK